MSMKHLTIFAFSAMVLTTAAWAAGEAAAAPPAQPATPGWGAGRGPGGAMGFLTSEERLMHFAEMQKATAGMSFEQARAWRLGQREKVMAMTAAERTSYAAGLKQRWDALPAAKQAEIRQQAETYWNSRPRGGRGGW
jgi:hypothetical protein